MADSFTNNLGLTKPEVGSSSNTWGSKLNIDLDQIDGIFTSASTTLISVVMKSDSKFVDATTTTKTMLLDLSGISTTTPRTLAAPDASGTIALNMPSAMIIPWAGVATVAPTGWLMCDGSAVSRTTFVTLFAAVNTAYGAGDGSTTFNVPDMRGRVAAGMDILGASTSANRLNSAIASTTLGASGGAQSTSPNIVVSGSVLSSGDNADIQVQGGSGSNVANAGHAHTVTMTSNGANVIPTVQPTMVFNYIIKT